MKRWKFPAALLAAVLILTHPQAAVNGAQSAMRLWVYSVAPALFPFLALMPALTGPDACAAYEAAFSWIMGPLFGLKGSAAPAVIIGMVSGSPGGAVALRRIAAQTGMPAAQTARAALAVCGLSPAYLILGVGQGLYGSAALGVRLALIQAAVQLGLLVLLKPACRGIQGKPLPVGEAQAAHPIRDAVETVLAVCGYMVLFSVLAAVVSTYIGETAGRFLLPAADLPSGLPGLVDSPVLLAAAVGFGGLCIAVQNLDVLRGSGVPTGLYFAVRCLSALLCAGAATLFLPNQTAGGSPVFSSCLPYAASLLGAALAFIPVLIYISKNIFLNKEQPREKEDSRV